MPKLRFIHAPPLKTGRTKRNKLPTMPRGATAEWERSVYFYWWAFLRENEDYLLTCANDGHGPCAEIYKDFGDVRDDDFWQWWQSHSLLFAEPRDRKSEIVLDTAAHIQRPNCIVIEVPLEGKLSYRITEVRRELSKLMTDTRHRKPNSEAKYAVIGKPVTNALANYLATWKLRKAYPKLPFSDIYDIINGKSVDIEEASKPKTNRRTYYKTSRSAGSSTKTQMAYRNYKFASEIVKNVSLGKFPLFNENMKNRRRNEKKNI